MNSWSPALLAMIQPRAASFANIPARHGDVLRRFTGQLTEFLRDVGQKADAIEADPGNNAHGRATKLAALAEDRLRALAAFTPLQVCESEVQRRLDVVQHKAKQAMGAAGADASEIRSHIKAADNSMMEATRLVRADPSVAAAIVNAKAFLSGLSASDVDEIRRMATDKTDPGATAEIAQLTAALAANREAIESARRLISERAKVKKVHEGLTPDGGNKVEATA
jgi:hypothetical protein